MPETIHTEEAPRQENRTETGPSSAELPAVVTVVKEARGLQANLQNSPNSGQVALGNELGAAVDSTLQAVDAVLFPQPMDVKAWQKDVPVLGRLLENKKPSLIDNFAIVEDESSSESLTVQYETSDHLRVRMSLSKPTPAENAALPAHEDQDPFVRVDSYSVTGPTGNTVQVIDPEQKVTPVFMPVGINHCRGAFKRDEISDPSHIFETPGAQEGGAYVSAKAKIPVVLMGLPTSRYDIVILEHERTHGLHDSTAQAMGEVMPSVSRGDIDSYQTITPDQARLASISEGLANSGSELYALKILDQLFSDHAANVAAVKQIADISRNGYATMPHADIGALNTAAVNIRYSPDAETTVSLPPTPPGFTVLQ